MFRKLYLCALALCVVGCGPRYVDYFPYNDDGSSKPCVALMPIKDVSGSGLPWDLSEELTQDMQFRAMDNGKLFLLSPHKVDTIVKKLGPNIDYFGKDMRYAKDFNDCEFLVVLEQIEHSIVPYERGKLSPHYIVRSNNCDEVLKMKTRLRIIDLRGSEPCLTLQEIFESNHMIAKDYRNFDYEKDIWGTPSYHRTALGMAHQRLAKDLVCRIETVTQAAR